MIRRLPQKHIININNMDIDKVPFYKIYKKYIQGGYQ